MALEGPPPPFDWNRLDCRASIDYFRVFSEVRVAVPLMSGTALWTPNKSDRTSWDLTVHDPTFADVQAVVAILNDPGLTALEVAVDLLPKSELTSSEREELLASTFKAVAGRFRPEDATEWGYGKRGSVTGPGQPLKPFHRRFPSSEEELIYGHRGGFMQAKAYLKRFDQGAALSAPQQRVRMEVSLRRAAIQAMMSQSATLSDLTGFAYRKVFARHFRLIDRPDVRARRRLSSEDRGQLEKRMHRAWNTAGVGKFAPDLQLPADTAVTAVTQIKVRAKEQLSRLDFVLRRDQRSNSKVGVALQRLQRRMEP